MSYTPSQVLVHVFWVELFMLSVADIADPLEAVLYRYLGSVLLIYLGAS